MKRFTLIIALCSIVILLMGQTRNISVDDAQVIANRNAAIKWDNVSPADPIIYYSADDKIVAYRFNYAINKPFPDKNTVLQECAEGKQNGDRKAQWGNGNYGNILMSARTDLPVNLEHGLGISSEFAYHEYLQEQAEAHLGPNYSLKRIYYINAVNVWHHYTNGSKDIYVKAHAPAKIGDYEVFKTAISEYKFFCETGDYNNQWDQYLFGGKKMSKDEYFIVYHDECCPFYDWSFGCSPTAAAMLYAYWDHMSMYSNWNFSNFVDYHSERTDPLGGGACDIDTHCPNVMSELAQAMGTNLSTGSTEREDIAPGYNTVAANNGYYFGVEFYDQYTPAWYIAVVKGQINDDEPLHISLEGHSVLAVGYNDDSDVATHYTHQPWVVWITFGELEAVYPYYPIGPDGGLGIEIIKPDGDQDYYGAGTGETMYAGDVYEITWDYDPYPDSYVRLKYSTDHGIITSWIDITSNTPNDGVYDWVIPSGINSDACRIKISAYTPDGTFSGSDGSYGDFRIFSGGSIYTLFSDSKVTTITTPDYYQFSNPYSTWCAVGVRPNSFGENWNIKMFSNQTFTTELASSAYADPVDFIVQDRHHSGSSLKGIKTYRTFGSNMASIEFEGDQETLSIGTNGSYSWPAGDVVEMFDVYLTPGVYEFDLDLASGSGDLDFALFGSTDAVYYKNRESFLARSTNYGAAVDEYFTIAVTTSDYYGLCVWANDGNSSSYNIEIHDPDPGTWEGDNSQYWGDANNWSFGILPDASTDVTIPAGTLFDCMLSYGSATCNSLTVSSGAVLNINGQSLTLMDMSIDGSIGMLQDNSYINIYGDVEWNSGSTLNTSSNNTYINVYGNWNFNAGANVNPGLGFVDFRGTSTNYIRCYSNNCSFYNLRIYKSGGASLGLSALSTENFVVNNLTYLNTGAILNGYSTHGMLMKGSFNYYGTFDFNTGSVIFDGTNIRQYGTGSGTFNNVIFNSTTGSHMINGDMTVTNDLTIQQGYFSPDTNTVFVAGDWINNVGAGGFIPGTGRVTFNGGDYHQYCSNETFYELEIDKPLGGAFRMNGANVECAAYDWTAGAVDVITGSFTANDLIDDGIFGAFYTNPGGIINLHQPTGFADLNGDLILTGGGEINIYGSGSSWIPYAANASITMSGGIIDFKSTSLRIHDAYTLTTNITGGTIRTIGNFANYRTDFNPTAGTLEMYGSSDATLYQDTPSNYLFDVVINKVNDDGSTLTITPDKRDTGNSTKGSKANNVNMTSDILINNNLTISAGSLSLNGHELTVLGDCDVYGELVMTNVADVLNVGNAAYENLFFRNGSYGNLTAGVVNLASWVGVSSGGLLTATTGNTMNFIDGNESGIQVDEPGSVFGNINIISTSPCYLSSNGGYTVEVNGNFDLQAGNTFDFQNNSLVVHGNFTDDPTSIIYAYNGPVDGGNTKIFSAAGEVENQNNYINDENTKSADESGAKGGYLEIDTDFTLTGLMDVGDGNVLIHGLFDEAASGSLLINGGTFICDAPATAACWVAGNFNMNDGLFEISNNHLYFSALSTINGGTIRSGGTFWANVDGNFQATGGTVELVGTGSTGQYIQVHANNYFHDLTINRTNTIQIYTGHNLNIKNNFTILSGGLNTNTRDMYVGGNWDNTVGTNAFLESSGKVVLNGPGPAMQFVNSDEHFNILENNTVQAIRVNSFQDTVECNSYNWISGGVSVAYGTFIANDLAQGGIYGNYYAHTNSKIHLYQDQNAGSYVDLHGDILIYGNGFIKVYGGIDVSYWSYFAPLDIDINSGGVLDFVDIGINMFAINPLTYDLADGTIRTGGPFTCQRSDFNPTGSTFEFYGGTEASINVTAGSTLFNVLINKSGGDKSIFEYKDRNGSVIESTKSNNAILSNDLVIEGELIVDEGWFQSNSNSVDCYGDINVNDGGDLILDENTTLAIGNGSGLYVNNGGWLITVASAGLEAQITHISGYYDLWVENGGNISAKYTIFEYMTQSGVYLRPGSLVYIGQPFDYCTFRNGYPGGNLISIYNDQTFLATETVFPTNSWGGANNVYKNATTGDVTFYNASGGFAGPAYENDTYDKVHWTTTPYAVDLKVFLEGPFNGATTKMDLDLNSLGLIPTSQPFDSNPLADWYYTGSESVGSIPTLAIDWILVELRDAPNVASALPGRSIAMQAAFVLNNGNVVDLDGLPLLEFDAAVFNNLYVNIWHRNHLGVISSNPLIDIGGTYTYNFFSGSGQAYGGTSAQKQLSPGIWGILSGDANGNGFIGQPDKVNIWGIQAGEAGYKAGDFNLDGQVNNPDKNDLWVPNFGAGSYIPE